MRLPSRLHRNRHEVFGYRVLIPRVLRHRFANPEIRLTLKTTDPGVAKRLSQQFSPRLSPLYARLSNMTDLDPDDATWLLLSNLTAERDRFIADLFQDAEDSAAVNDQRDRQPGGC